MRWSVWENEPDLVRTDARILLDGGQVRRVVEFDTDEGWVRAHCLDDHTGHGGKSHLDPDDPDEVCMVTLHGEVELVVPEEA